jgi:hypothetical protein
VGPRCSSCGTFTGPFSEVEGLFTVLICIPCLEVRLARRDSPISGSVSSAAGSAGSHSQRTTSTSNTQALTTATTSEKATPGTSQ